MKNSQHKDSSKRRVVVTGIGMISSLGNDLDETWTHLLELKTGLKPIEEVHPDKKGFGVHLVAQAVDFNLSELGVHRKFAKKVDRSTKLLIYSALRSLQAAQIRYPEDTEELEVGAIIGTGSALAEDYEGMSLDERKPTWVLDTYPNLRLAQLSIAASLKGYGSTIVNACSSGNQAIGEAYEKIQAGKENILLAGASDSKITPQFMSGFSRLNMTVDSNDAETAMRPFDKDRAGFVIGEGACVLVLESLEHAQKRQVKPIAEIVGYGSSLDAGSLTNCDANGKYMAMKRAMDDAQIRPEDIDYINSHGTATVSNDIEETKAIKQLFNGNAPDIPINSCKSMMGHTFAASGAIEAAICIKSLEKQRVHATKNFVDGQDCDLDYVAGKYRDHPMTYCINNSSGLGGFNSSVVLKRIEATF